MGLKPAGTGNYVIYEILSVGLRTRVATIPELALQCRRPEDVVRGAVEELHAAGLLRYDGERITYLHPEDTVAGAIATGLAGLRDTIDGRVQSLELLVESLPGLVDDWRRYISSGGHSVPVDVFHGHDAIKQIYPQSHLSTGEELRVVIPSAQDFFVLDERSQAWHDAIRASGQHVRLILSLADTSKEEAQDRIRRELELGVEIRALADPPSWFWTFGNESVALPFSWPEIMPTSVAIYHSPVITKAFTWCFERLWEQAVPMRPVTGESDALLRLIEQGATVEAAARSLGISARTAHRRLSDAMDVYGARNLFALGAAWARASEGHLTSGSSGVFLRDG